MRIFTVILSIGAVLAVAAPADAFHDSTVPGFPDVLAEYVQIPGSAAPGTPAALNSVSFLRVRPLRYGLFPGRADAVVIAQPGFASTPGIWLELAAQLVRKAEQQQCKRLLFSSRCVVEVWIIDRRGSQVEDTSGLRIAKQNNDPQTGIAHYYGTDILTPAGRFPLPPNGDFDALLGAPGAAFQPLTQNDLAFAAEWGFETMAADVEALIALLSPQGTRRNIFLAGHSQGGGFVANFAGRQLANGKRAHEVLAGLIFLDGGPSIGATEAPTAADIGAHVGTVQAIRAGLLPRFGTQLGGIQLGSGLGVFGAVTGLFYELAPDAETIFPLTTIPAHPAGFCFLFGAHLPAFLCPDAPGIGLRLTNRAHAGMSFDDDPIPGYFLQTAVVSALGQRSGRLDFDPVAADPFCAVPGPFNNAGEPPCPPSAAQIDPTRVYDWLDGGGNGPAGPDGVLNGWTSFDNGVTLEQTFANPLPNPSQIDTFIHGQGFSPARTNVYPVTVDFADSGVRTIDAGEMNGFTWYQATRYDLDMQFLGRFQKIAFASDDVVHDIDKTAIDLPVYAVSRGLARQNPFPLVADYTAIGAALPGAPVPSVIQTATAAATSPVDAAINTNHYGHVDFLTADDSLVDLVAVGEPGANVVSNTLIDWILTRKAGRTQVPNPILLGVRNAR